MKRIHSMADDSLRAAGGSSLTASERERIENRIFLALAALACLFAGLIYRSLFPSQTAVTGFIFLAGCLIGASPAFVAAAQGFLSPNTTNSTEILVTIAILASFVSGSHVTAVLIPVILSCAHFFEERSILGGREAIEGLRRMQAKTALLVEDGAERSVDAASLVPGQIVAVKPGMTFPIDGTVLSGKSNVDQKSLTGESLPQSVKAGDPVYAGTVNLDGPLTVRVDKPADNTSFAKILELMHRAERITIPEARVIDTFLHYYIPFSLAAAGAVGLFTHDISRAIAILVVSCPCGQLLVSSAPMIAALGTASRHGLLIKNSKFIEDLTRVDTVVLDKTGTLTLGELQCTDLQPQPGVTKSELLEAAAVAAKDSLHPISRAVAAAAGTAGSWTDWEVREHSGRGMEARRGGDVILFGSAGWLTEEGFDVPDVSNIGPVSWTAKNGRLLGCLLFGDQVRNSAPEAMGRLRQLGVKRIVMLTGDNDSSAQAVGKACGMDDIRSRLLPEDKLEAVRELRGSGVVLVAGDGVNDVPALAEADVGLALGAMGSDAAVDSADVALMNNDLNHIPFALDLARSTRRIIVQNVALTFSISFVMIALSAAGIVVPLTGAVLHNVGAFAVLLNSSRLLSLTPEGSLSR
ncbi:MULTISPECIES: heavy metal translocating P-type ATPase [Jonquetella]|uniref:Heavy metal-translocating P-type ATPase, Cd/Co/Hg/Pb/Zn-transporting n=1 Tax=Jonquetella anthropi DSM 22815 TaxID=885272 RepID=H0UIU0_9BACT|nr:MULTISPECIES: cation-translocating P-type ATPase [Jonquetella]EHM12734.1 heavy metal-translocating P-type ATPase, Cd/Co/Hg/Pb/Zn-transporting [Jonquetella anthropi DSM 22815]ERL23405.1 cadmium-exporting ATPase [Jonquetella sp. BV3C21]